MEKSIAGCGFGSPVFVLGMLTPFSPTPLRRTMPHAFPRKPPDIVQEHPTGTSLDAQVAAKQMYSEKVCLFRQCLRPIARRGATPLARRDSRAAGQTGADPGKDPCLFIFAIAGETSLGYDRFVSASAAQADGAPVAQLDRVLDSDSKGHRFESCRVRQSINGMTMRTATSSSTSILKLPETRSSRRTPCTISSSTTSARPDVVVSRRFRHKVRSGFRKNHRAVKHA